MKGRTAPKTPADGYDSRRLCGFGYATSEPAPVVVVVIMTCGGLCNVLWIVQCSIAFWKRSSFSGGR